MTDSDSDTRWEDWLAAVPEPDPDAERFKWGWNEAHGEEVWEVGGPGDGWPAHTDQLTQAWGRKLRRGDVIGTAEYVPARGTDLAVVSIEVYGERVPDAVADWFREAFPNAEVRLT